MTSTDHTITTSNPAEWHHLIREPLTEGELAELERAELTVEAASIDHAARSRYTDRHHAGDRATCPQCFTLVEATIALLGLVSAAQGMPSTLPVGTTVLYKGSLVEAHGYYTVEAVFADACEVVYTLRGDGARLRGVAPYHIAPLSS